MTNLLNHPDGLLIVTAQGKTHPDSEELLKRINAHHQLVSLLQDASLQLGRLTGDNLTTYARTFAALSSNSLSSLTT